MRSADTRRIAVVGAGIGGLTLAIALGRYGIEVDIYEQTAELREVGAAIACLLGPASVCLRGTSRSPTHTTRP